MTKQERREKHKAGVTIIRPRLFQRGAMEYWYIAGYSENGRWERYNEKKYSNVGDCLGACGNIEFPSFGKIEVDYDVKL